MDRCRPSGTRGAGVSSHMHHLGMLSIAQKEGCSVKMDETQVMASTSLLALLYKNHEDVTIFKKALFLSGVAGASVEVTTENELAWLHFVWDVGLESLQ